MTIMTEDKKWKSEELKEALGFKVDLPAQGSGNTSNGNGTRRFFSNASKSSAIKKVDE